MLNVGGGFGAGQTPAYGGGDTAAYGSCQAAAYGGAFSNSGGYGGSEATAQWAAPPQPLPQTIPPTSSTHTPPQAMPQHSGGYQSFQSTLAASAAPQSRVSAFADPWATAPPQGAGDGGGDFLSMLAAQTANWHGQRQ